MDKFTECPKLIVRISVKEQFNTRKYPTSLWFRLIALYLSDAESFQIERERSEHQEYMFQQCK